MRTAAKRDTTEAAIVEALRAHGVHVVRLNQAGLPDLLCHDIQSRLYLLEIKSRRGTLTSLQAQTRLPFSICHTVAEALDDLRRRRVVASGR